eukprot:gnl/TRDRNA2_/TRDRNA2_171403_c0_seq3.p1 gnl/TRDRNA2_/TRDRNA2_171403_c0~~gnl/TRDRNA2_/TRDRNA2_171403_c0_seq3.p1  ORF type:complete len:486 (-),score=102.80 gnl/TRDRNA2_/TRDRNA2_171403_c0_seq3:119-1576(-)
MGVHSGLQQGLSPGGSEHADMPDTLAGSAAGSRLAQPRRMASHGRIPSPPRSQPPLLPLPVQRPSSPTRQVIISPTASRTFEVQPRLSLGFPTMKIGGLGSPLAGSSSGSQWPPGWPLPAAAQQPMQEAKQVLRVESPTRQTVRCYQSSTASTATSSGAAAVAAAYSTSSPVTVTAAVQTARSRSASPVAINYGAPPGSSPRGRGSPRVEVPGLTERFQAELLEAVESQVRRLVDEITRHFEESISRCIERERAERLAEADDTRHAMELRLEELKTAFLDAGSKDRSLVDNVCKVVDAFFLCQKSEVTTAVPKRNRDDGAGVAALESIVGGLVENLQLRIKRMDDRLLEDQELQKRHVNELRNKMEQQECKTIDLEEVQVGLVEEVKAELARWEKKQHQQLEDHQQQQGLNPQSKSSLPKEFWDLEKNFQNEVQQHFRELRRQLSDLPSYWPEEQHRQLSELKGEVSILQTRLDSMNKKLQQLKG